VIVPKPPLGPKSSFRNRPTNAIVIIVFHLKARIERMASPAFKKIIGLIITTVIIGIAIMPLGSSFPKIALDPSWQSVVQWAFVHSKSFGTDIVFTFGPLGFLHTHQFQPDLFVYRLIFWFTVVLAVGAFLSRYWARIPIWVSLILSYALLVTAGPRDTILIALPLVLALEVFDARERPRPWLVSLLLLLMIITGLVKFSGFMVAFAVLLIVDFVRAVHGRSFPLYSLIFIVGSWVAFWIVGGDPNWLAYLQGGIDLSSGYSSAMQIATNNPALSYVFPAILAGFGLLVWGYARDTMPWRTPQRIGVAASIAIFLFFSFKAGLTRAGGGHTVILTSALAFIASIGAFLTFSLANSRVPKFFALILVSFTSWMHLSNIALSRPNNSAIGWAYVHAIKRPIWKYHALRGLLAGDEYSNLEKKRRIALERIREEVPLPQLTGSVDVYSPQIQPAVLAHGLNYNPRPIFQSYAAYTPRALKMNYDHLISADGPDYVLFSPNSVDNRLKALQDGMSWLPLMLNYEQVAIVNDMVLLKRDLGKRRLVQAQSSQRIPKRWNEAVTVPGSAPCVWAEIHIKPNIIGRLLTVMYRAPIVEISLELSNGQVHRRRFIPSMGTTGFLLSPILLTGSAFFQACSSTPTDDVFRSRVSRVRFHTSKVGLRSFEPNIDIILTPTVIMDADADADAGVSGSRWSTLQ